MVVDERRDVPSAAEIRRVTQPESVTGRDVEHWTAGLYLRRISPHVTRLALRAGLSANAVTGLMILTGLLAGAALLLGGLVGAVLALVLGQLQMLWDCSDGEVARWRRQQSVVGIFLDKLGHYGAELALCVCLGLRVADLPGAGRVGELGPVLGALLAALVLLNRAVNEMVHASRAAGGLPPLGVAGTGRGTPSVTWVARLRAAARYVPVHRGFHSVELTVLVLLGALGDLTGAPVTGWLLVVLVPAAALTVVGHVVAVLTSARLR